MKPLPNDEVLYPASYFLRLIEVYTNTLRLRPSRLVLKVGNITLSPVRRSDSPKGVLVRIRSTDPVVQAALRQARQESALLNKLLVPEEEVVNHALLRSEVD